MPIYPDNIAKYIAQSLLSIEAIKINTENYFQWSAGISSPIYCDNRKLLSYPKIRSYIKNSLVLHITEYFSSSLEAIAGVATAGISYGTLVADSLELPFYYVRNEAKKHGLKNNVEGKKITKHQKVVVIEDLISTGRSALNACKSLQDVGANVLGVASIINYDLGVSKKNFSAAKIPLYSLCNFSVIFQEIANTDPKTAKKLQKWHYNLSAMAS